MAWYAHVYGIVPYCHTHPSRPRSDAITFPFFRRFDSGQLCRIIDTVSWADVDEVSESLADIFSCDTGSGAITSLSWSVDGKWIALGNSQGGIHVLKSGDWDLISDPAETKGRYNLASGSFAGTE